MNETARRYAITMIVCTLIVDAFAAIQYHLIQDHPFTFSHYIIPTLVGAGFGFLIAGIKILEIWYHNEKDQGQGSTFKVALPLAPH